MASRISPKPPPYEETLKTIEYLKGQTESSIVRAALEQNLAFLEHWEANGVAEEFRKTQKFNEILSDGRVTSIEPNEALNTSSASINFPKSGLRSQALSDMPSEIDLKRVVAVGKITPAVDRTTTFCCNELRIPNPTGTHTALSYDELPLEGSRLFTPPNYGEALVRIESPNFLKSTRIPMPVGAELASLKGGYKVERPSDYDPVIWRVRGRPENIEYGINKINGGLKISSEAFQALSPTQNEQAYWQSALMFAPEVREHLTNLSEAKKIGELFSSVSSIMLHNDKTTNLTNFAYVCNPSFGEVLKEHRENLPLFMSLLKRGHCDYLSWYFTAAMRGFGVPCFMTTDIAVTPDGKAFNSANLHARGLFINEFNEILTFCPASRVQFDGAYHSDNLDESLIFELDDSLRAAQTREAKVDAILSFKRGVDATRNQLSHPFDNPSEYLRSMGSSIGKLLLETESEGEREVVSLDSSGSSSEIVDDNLTIYDRLALMDSIELNGRSCIDLLVETDYEKININYFETKLNFSVMFNHARKVGIPSFLLNRYLSCGFGDRDDSPFTSINETHLKLTLNDRSTCLDEFINASISGKLPIGVYYFHDFISHQITRHLSSDLLSLLKVYKLSGETIRTLKENGKINDFIRGDLYFLDTSKDITNISDRKAKSLLLDFIVLGFFAHTTEKEGSTWSCYSQLSPKEWDCFRREIVFPGRNQVPTKSRYGLRDLVLTPLPRDMSVYSGFESFGKILTIDSKDQAKLRSAFLRVLRSLDVAAAHSKEPVDFEFRKYAPGDDARMIDWNLSARSQELHVREQRGMNRGFVSPVHMLIDLEVLYPSNIPALETFCNSARDNARSYSRDLFIGFSSSRTGHELKSKHLFGNFSNFKGSFIDATSRLIFKVNEQDEGADIGGVGSILEGGKMPQNLIFITNSVAKEIQLRNLYGEHINLRTINITKPEYHVYLDVKKS